ALRRGELLRELGMPEQACEAFAIATQSPDREVAVRAQIGAVYCALETSDRKAEGQLQALLGRYPQLTQRESLSFALALARARWAASTASRCRLDRQKPHWSRPPRRLPRATRRPRSAAWRSAAFRACAATAPPPS